VVAALAGALLACGSGQPPVGPELPAISRLTKVHDYPMYLLDYQGDYRLEERLRVGDLRQPASRVPETSAWACSAFAAFGDATRPLVGRSFDWRDHVRRGRLEPRGATLPLQSLPHRHGIPGRMRRADGGARSPGSSLRGLTGQHDVVAGVTADPWPTKRPSTARGSEDDRAGSLDGPGLGA
jgi:hypothetical protein